MEIKPSKNSSPIFLFVIEGSEINSQCGNEYKQWGDVYIIYIK